MAEYQGQEEEQYRIGAKLIRWRDPIHYPRPTSREGARWAWEFLRRNRQYQSDYLAYKSSLAAKLTHLEHPLGDGVVLDGFFTDPPALSGERLSAYLKRHSDKKSTYLFWDEYIRFMWYLRDPVDPETEFDPASVRFISRVATWKRNFSKFPTTSRRRAQPFDHQLTVSPGEMVIRLRLNAMDLDDLALLVIFLRRQVKTFNRTASFHKNVDHHLYLALRLWDLDQCNSGLSIEERTTRKGFLAQLREEMPWKNYLRKLRSTSVVESPNWPGGSFLTQLRKFAKRLIERRGYLYLVRDSKRLKAAAKPMRRKQK